jgi:hypothetical protein
MQALSSSVFDHCPLLLSSLSTPRFNPRFKFESFWPQVAGFKECVTKAWSKSVPVAHNPMATLHVRLSRTAKSSVFLVKRDSVPSKNSYGNL